MHKLLIVTALIKFLIDFCNADGVTDSVRKERSIDGASFKTLGACKITLDSSVFAALRGPKGDKGYRGMKGARGLNGTDGVNGFTGPRGQRGPIGSPGVIGIDGKCSRKCVLKPKVLDEDDSARAGEGTKFDYGLQFKPSPELCHVKMNDEKFEGETWLNPENEFKVWCEKETGRTCLLVKEADKEHIENNAISYVNETEPFWLSAKNFNVAKFYNIEKLDWIDWLLSKSSIVTQKIRYHCKNSYLAERSDTALRMFGWNDVLIANEPELSRYGYSWIDNNCTSKHPKDEWHYADIIIKGKFPNILPVIDLQIRDVREDDQRFFVELVELCFE